MQFSSVNLGIFEHRINIAFLISYNTETDIDLSYPSSFQVYLFIYHPNYMKLGRRM